MHMHLVEQVAALQQSAAERTEAIDGVRAELRLVLIEALRGLRQTVPGLDTTGRHEITQPAALAVCDVLDYAAVAGELLGVLRHSRCPLVADFKTKLATRYADSLAPELARVRGLAR